MLFELIAKYFELYCVKIIYPCECTPVVYALLTWGGELSKAVF